MGFDGIRRHLTIGESGPPLSETWFLARPNSLGSDALCLCNNDHMWEASGCFCGIRNRSWLGAIGATFHPEEGRTVSFALQIEELPETIGCVGMSLCKLGRCWTLQVHRVGNSITCKAGRMFHPCPMVFEHNARVDILVNTDHLDLNQHHVLTGR